MTALSPPSPTPPVVPETFEEVSRAMVLLKAYTFPERLDDNGLALLEKLLGALPEPEQVGEWLGCVTAELHRLRDAGLEPAEPPQVPKTTKKLNAAIRLLEQTAEPEGIPHRGQRVRLYHLLGGALPNHETAQVWRKVLEVRRDELVAEREKREAAIEAAKAKGSAPRRPKKTVTSKMETVIVKRSAGVEVATRRRSPAGGKFRG